MNRKEYYSLLLFCILCLFTAYFNLFDNSFVNFDDHKFIVKNTWIQDLTIENIKQMFTQSKEGHYQPLSWLLYALEYHYFKLNAFGYHSTVLFLHFLNAFILIHILKEFKLNFFIISSTVLLFISHPIYVESIAWKSAQSTVWSSFFSILSIYAYIRFSHTRSIKFILSAYLALVFGCLAKSQAIIIPVLWLILEVYLQKKIKIKSVLLFLPAFCISIVFGLLAIKASQDFGSFGSSIEKYTMIDRFFIISYACFFYIQKVFLPIHLSAIHFNPIKENGFLPTLYYFMPFAFLSFWYLVYFIVQKNLQTLAFIVCIFLACIGMVSQIIPIGDTIAAERYAYLSSIPILFIFSFGVNQFISSQKLKVSLLIISIFASIFLTHQRVNVWKSSFSLYSDLIEKNPTQFYAYFAFGVSLNDMGLYTNALHYLKIGDSLNPKSSNINHTMALAFHNQQLYDSAIYRFSKAIAFDVQHVDAYYNRAITYMQVDKKKEAIRDLTVVLGFNPNNNRALKNRASLKYQLSDYYGALRDLEAIDRLQGESKESIANKEKIFKKLKTQIDSNSANQKSIVSDRK